MSRMVTPRGPPRKRLCGHRGQPARRAAMRRELHALAARAGEGSTFVFYFQGHGLKQKEKTFFACYDVNLKDTAGTAFDVDELFPVLDREWKGERLFLLGDCCHA